MYDGTARAYCTHLRGAPAGTEPVLALCLREAQQSMLNNYV